MDQVRNRIGLNRWPLCPFTGNGVTVAILDTGIWGHVDFNQRIIGFCDFVYGRPLYYDDNGHGTHIAGIIGGSGVASNGLYRGVAPNVSYVVCKVLNRRGDGKTEHIIKGIWWCVLHKEQYQIRIMNISAGMSDMTKEKEKEALREAVVEAWNHGIIVITAAGNNGPDEGTITVPGTTKEVITVGTIEESGPIRLRSDKDNYSSWGPTKQCVVKPEILAPGNRVKSCGQRNGYVTKSGTSMAVGVVSGVVALMLEKEPQLTPVEIKKRLYERSIPMKNFQQRCWGEIDVPSLLN